MNFALLAINKVKSARLSFKSKGRKVLKVEVFLSFQYDSGVKQREFWCNDSLRLSELFEAAGER